MSVSAKIGGLFDKVSGIGGELAAINAAIRDCKPQYPPEVDEKFNWAKKIMHDLNFDRLNRTGDIGFEEAQVNQKLYNEVEAIFNAKVNADEQAEKKKKELHELKQGIERDINRWRSRRLYLEGQSKDQHDAECGKLERRLREHRYTLERDKRFLLSEFGKYEDEIKSLQERMVAAEDFDRIEMALQIRDAELRRQNFMMHTYPKYKDEFEAKEKQIREWERQHKVWNDGHKAALLECDAELIRLIGRAE